MGMSKREFLIGGGHMAIFLGTRLSHVKSMIFGYEEEPVPENPEEA